ncbi:MAG: ribosome-associated translation inhibitor RaiA [Lachnospiraceae bacterium]|nr:ribosome-associated translation inhibitor RaiA [Lachnospiraceae bacterium]
MQYTFNGKNIEVTNGMKNAVYEKIGKLERYFMPDTEVHVTMAVERNIHKIEITIPVKGSILRAEEQSEDMYSSIDLVQDVLERQVKKYRSKIAGLRSNRDGDKANNMESDDIDDDNIKIKRVKKFAVKPMDPEEACIQMDMLGHNFYVFRNSETNEVNVVYKRHDDTYGLIEPGF